MSPLRDTHVDILSLNKDLRNGQKNTCKTGFTLAEVLITLGIIGIIAALTLPVLIANHKEKQTVTKLKKVYSTFSNAYIQAINEYGTPDMWDNFAYEQETAESTMVFFNKLKPYLQIVKECDFNNRFDCWDTNDYFYCLNGNKSVLHIHNGFTKTFILQNGIKLGLYVHNTQTKPNPGCETNDNFWSCASLYVKTDNSNKQVFGKNIFGFNFKHNVVTPFGKNANMQICSDLGDVCTAWVIFNENMEYTKCSDLSWNGKRKCN